jgi:hypothetical protein
MDRKIDVVDAAVLLISSPWMGTILRKLCMPVIGTSTTQNRELNILMLKFRLLTSGMIRAYYRLFGKMYCSHFQGQKKNPSFGLVGLHSQKNVTVSNTATRV